MTGGIESGRFAGLLTCYVETTERTEKLETKIQQTDDRIDEFVYESDGLTDEEIEIVEEAVEG